MSQIDRFDLQGGETGFGPLLRAQAVGDSTLREYHDTGMTSGSGSGMTQLVPRTLAKQIELLKEGGPIGQGRYGQVWLGYLNGDPVAVKVFNSYYEDSWIREKEIYLTGLLRHENILRFIGADLASCNSATQMWLVTQYHRNRSLYDYLNNQSINPKEAFVLIESVLAGITHLHLAIEAGTHMTKPQIAHRDLKSKNILVTEWKTCVIADFGLAVTHKESFPKENNRRVGTIRYMSPEVLDNR